MDAPVVSLLLLTYRQEDMVREAALACLAQAGGPYEIIFSDDASPDGTFEVLKEVAAGYRGPHRLVVRRNEVNLGIGGHYNRLVDVAQGELLVTAAGDDLSLPNRLAELAAAWEATGRRADLVSSHLVDLDHQGRLHELIRVDDLAEWHGVDDWLAGRPYVVGAAHAFTKRMMRFFGPLATDIAYEDQVMTFRALLLGGGVIVDKPLVHYRRGGTSRLPIFESAEEAWRWQRRQDDREYVEVPQLLADAKTAGLADDVIARIRGSVARQTYKHELRTAPTPAARWAVFRQPSALPLGWRLRKLLHALFPMLSFTLKHHSSKLHKRRRRQLRESREANAPRP